MPRGATDPAAGATLAAGEFSLRVPPDPRCIRTTRLFGAAVARLYGAAETTVEDLKVALSEACSGVIGAQTQGEAAQPVTVIVRPGPASLTFEVSGASGGLEPIRSVPLDVAMPDATVGLALIKALFDSARFERTPTGGTSVTFSIDV